MKDSYKQFFQKRFVTSKILVFDIDNTLYDYDDCNKKAYSKTFELISKDFSWNIDFWYLLGACKDYVKMKIGYESASSHNRVLYFKKMMEVMGSKNVAKDTIKYYGIYNKEFLSNMKCFNYVKPLFEYCKTNNIRIGICTDMTCEIQLKKLISLGLSNKVEYIITSEEAGIEKPNSMIYHKLMKDMGDFDATHYMFIGDDETKDVDGPRQVGMNSMNVKELLEL